MPFIGKEESGSFGKKKNKLNGERIMYEYKQGGSTEFPGLTVAFICKRMKY